MQVTLIVTVQSGAELALAQRLVAGRPWVVRLVERLGRARAVARVIVACRSGHRELAALVDSETAAVVNTDDPAGLALAITADHDGIVFCPVLQLFADPDRLDALAACDRPPDAERMVAVLHDDESIELTGGAFVEIVSPAGLRARAAGADITQLQVARWPTWPDAPEMRLQTEGDADWAIAAEEAVRACHPRGDLADFGRVLRDACLHRFAFWDDMGVAPRSILVARCMRPPLFEHFLGYLGRLPGVAIDVVCRSEQVDDTRQRPEVGEVFAFEGATFSTEALGTDTLEAIGRRRYDLCVIPRREPTGWGFENVTHLAAASGASAAIWLDIFGRFGYLAGQPHGWDPTFAGGPHHAADAYLRRAVRALDRFAPTAGRA